MGGRTGVPRLPVRVRDPNAHNAEPDSSCLRPGLLVGYPHNNHPQKNHPKKSTQYSTSYGSGPSALALLRFASLASIEPEAEDPYPTVVDDVRT